MRLGIVLDLSSMTRTSTLHILRSGESKSTRARLAKAHVCRRARKRVHAHALACASASVASERTAASMHAHAYEGAHAYYTFCVWPAPQRKSKLAAQPFFFSTSSVMGIQNGLDPLGSPEKADPRSPIPDPHPRPALKVDPATSQMAGL